MILYILKFSACLAVFLLFYKLVLEKESMHVFKRFYLLSALLLSIGIPFITFTYYIEPSANLASQIIQNNSLNNTASEPSFQTNYLSIILWSVYAVGVLLFGLIFIKNLYKLSYRIKHNPKKKINSITNVLLQDLIIPHTFFNYIFFNKQKFEAHQIPKEVFWHEETHATQKHSIDVLFIEVLQVLFWFNPLIFVLKHVMKLNHEFLADQAVLNKGIETTTYQQTLLAYSSNALHPQLANAINYSLIKKRFIVMKTKTSKKGIWLRSIVLLPILAILLFSFSSKEIIHLEANTKAEQQLNKIQEKATAEQIAEYNKLAKKYNDMPKDNMVIKSNDLERLKYLYQLMSPEQRKTAEAFPVLPPPPAPEAPEAPKVIKGKMNPPPPPPPDLPENATPKQKGKYKEGYKDAQIAAKVLRLKAEKGELVKVRELQTVQERELVRVQEIRSAEERKKMMTEKMAHRKAQIAARTLKLKAQKEDLIRVRAIRSDENRERLKTVRLAHREAQVATKVLKLKAQKEQLVRVRAIRSAEDRERLKTVRLAHREAQVAAKVLKLKAQKEQLVRVKEIRTAEERKKLREEKRAYKKAQAEIKALKNKSKRKKN